MHTYFVQHGLVCRTRSTQTDLCPQMDERAYGLPIQRTALPSCPRLDTHPKTFCPLSVIAQNILSPVHEFP